MDGCGLDRIPADHEQDGRDGSVDDSFGDRADDGVIRDANGVCALVAVISLCVMKEFVMVRTVGSRNKSANTAQSRKQTVREK